jgi:hypothetical protein
VCLWLALAGNAAAQDQTIIVDQPLQLCGPASRFPLATFDEDKAKELIEAALPKPTPPQQLPDPTTYYIIHATEFVPGRMVVAAEHWYVYYKPWQQKSSFWWFRDSRQFKHFREQRIFGSSRVAIIYLYVNVPTYSSRDSFDKVADFFLAQRLKTELEADAAADKELASSNTGMTAAQRLAGVQARRAERVRDLETSLKDELPAQAEQEAATRAQARAAAARKAAVTPEAQRAFNESQDLHLLSALEAERYFKALSEHRAAITDEFPLVDNETGETLKGLSPTLATTGSYESLVNLFYSIEVTKKIPAPVQNLKAAIKLAFGGQAATAQRLGVTVQPSSVCAGRPIVVDHIPSDMMVKALVGAESDTSPSERSQQLFDNEGRYWWDVSFALPLDLRRDVSIDVDAGQVAAKDVERADLFAVVNLGLPRDTKKIQWQLVPTFVYGIPITGKPLKHHLVGVTIGLNYVQLLAGVRFDRRQEIGTTVENGTTVGVETTPPGEKWEHKWVWGINIPVNTVVKMFTK